MHEKTFKNCSSLGYSNYEDMVDYIDSPKKSYIIDLHYINAYDNIFFNCTSLESIKLYEYKHFRKSVLLGRDNLHRISKLGYFHLHDEFMVQDS